MEQYRLNVIPDTDPQPPTDYGDDKAAFVHGRHRDFHVGPEMDKAEGMHQYPLYAYIHSGVHLSLGDPQDMWDSGQVGYVCITKDESDIPKPEEYAQGMVKEWNQYLSGDCWGFEIEHVETGDIVDSCWGFFGEDYCREEGTQMLECFNVQLQLAI